jgi:membrane protease YdiL (CAAX protease family)
MLSPTAKRRAWFLLAIATVSEAAALLWILRGATIAKFIHYTLTPPGNSASWMASAAVTVLYAAYSMRGLPLIGEYALTLRRWGEAAGLKLFAVPMALVTGYFEEMFFRRYIMDLALHHAAGSAMQIVISAVIFGAAHGVWALFGGLRAGVGAVISTGILGALLAGTYLIGERSLLPCVVSHIAINLVIEPWLVLSATTGRWNRAIAA